MARTRLGRGSRIVTLAAGGVVAAVLVGSVLMGGSPPTTGEAAPAASAGGAVVSRPRPQPGHEVYGFIPYWEMDAGIAAHLGETHATTIALFSVTHTSRGTIDSRQEGYRRIAGPIGRRIVADARERGARVDLTYTSF